jgi:hypothetical protein
MFNTIFVMVAIFNVTMIIPLPDLHAYDILPACIALWMREALRLVNQIQLMVLVATLLLHFLTFQLDHFCYELKVLSREDFI